MALHSQPCRPFPLQQALREWLAKHPEQEGLTWSPAFLLQGTCSKGNLLPAWLLLNSSPLLFTTKEGSSDQAQINNNSFLELE